MLSFFRRHFCGEVVAVGTDLTFGKGHGGSSLLFRFPDLITYFLRSLNAWFHEFVFMPYLSQRMHIGSSRRAPVISPMSTTPHPNAAQMSATVLFAVSSLPQTNMSGGPPSNFGLTICAYPTVLKALTTLDFGSHRCTCSPPESE